MYFSLYCLYFLNFCYHVFRLYHLKVIIKNESGTFSAGCSARCCSLAHRSVPEPNAMTNILLCFRIQEHPDPLTSEVPLALHWSDKLIGGKIFPCVWEGLGYMSVCISWMLCLPWMCSHVIVQCAYCDSFVNFFF